MEHSMNIPWYINKIKMPALIVLPCESEGMSRLWRLHSLSIRRIYFSSWHWLHFRRVVSHINGVRPVLLSIRANLYYIQYNSTCFNRKWMVLVHNIYGPPTPCFVWPFSSFSMCTCEMRCCDCWDWADSSCPVEHGKEIHRWWEEVRRIYHTS